MSTLQRQHPLTRAQNFVSDIVRDVLNRDERLQQYANTFEVSVQPLYGTAEHRIEVWCGNLCVMEVQVRDYDLHDNIGLIKERVKLMSDADKMVAQIYHARLAEHFPRAVKGVEVKYFPHANVREVIITFRNGHTVNTLEGEMFSAELLARCAMVYDLPSQ